MAGKNERSNQQLYLKQVPEGIAGPDDFEVRDVEVPELEEGQALVESHYFGLDAALRLIVRDSDEFLFRVKPGDLVRGTAGGKVINPRPWLQCRRLCVGIRWRAALLSLHGSRAGAL